MDTYWNYVIFIEDGFVVLRVTDYMIINGKHCNVGGHDYAMTPEKAHRLGSGVLDYSYHVPAPAPSGAPMREVPHGNT